MHQTGAGGKRNDADEISSESSIHLISTWVRYYLRQVIPEERAFAPEGNNMRNAALVLGVIGGLIAMVIGFFGYGYTEVVRNYSEVEQIFGGVENADTIRLASFLAPLLAIAGGAMSKIRALWGGVLMIVAGALMYFAFGFGVFTMFPIGFCLVGGLLAIAAGKPDEPKAHF